jgi:hypothetical protein
MIMTMRTIVTEENKAVRMPLQPDSPELIIIDLLEFRSPKRWMPWRGDQRPNLYVDGKRFDYETGAWAYWIPALRCKFLYSMLGRLDCRFTGVPSRQTCESAADPDSASGNHSPYTWQDWRNVYAKKAARRAAELYVATERLHKAGIGPRPLGICMARSLVESGHADIHGAFGISTENVLQLPIKVPATEDEFLRAGVQPDRIRSCIRQQLRGYAIDLNSAVGAMPINAEAEIAAIEAFLETHAYSNPAPDTPTCI